MLEERMKNLTGKLVKAGIFGAAVGLFGCIIVELKNIFLEISSGFGNSYMDMVWGIVIIMAIIFGVAISTYLNINEIKKNRKITSILRADLSKMEKDLETLSIKLAADEKERNKPTNLN